MSIIIIHLIEHSFSSEHSICLGGLEIVFNQQ
ncbi:BnaA09g03990D [Brassica napus]|uniref:BnaA09g03990D protein n=1 Tax=Brassica napus TaxID=3708 RepID=A0A078G335_BRANA|nr:BnaA09g03990D [Brassica napus]